jgi:hypothetical protein
MHHRAIFLPVISVDSDGVIEAEWMQSYTNTQDMESPTFEDVDDELGEPLCELLDNQLRQIRALLSEDVLDDGVALNALRILIRPFFEEA